MELRVLVQGFRVDRLKLVRPPLSFHCKTYCYFVGVSIVSVELLLQLVFSPSKRFRSVCTFLQMTRFNTFARLSMGQMKERSRGKRGVWGVFTNLPSSGLLRFCLSPLHQVPRKRSAAIFLKSIVCLGTAQKSRVRSAML